MRQKQKQVEIIEDAALLLHDFDELHEFVQNLPYNGIAVPSVLKKLNELIVRLSQLKERARLPPD